MKYPASIRIYHWLSAALIMALLAAGIYMTSFDQGDMELFSRNLYFWHKSFGMLVLFIVLLRIINRLGKHLPKLPGTIPKRERVAAHVAHRAMYVLIVLIPLAGYAMSSAYEGSSGVHFFFVDLPELIPDNETVYEIASFLHEWLSYLLIALLAAHILGALKHRFFDKEEENDVLKRML